MISRSSFTDSKQFSRNFFIAPPTFAVDPMFPEKFDFDGETYRTNSYNKVLDVIYLQTNELRGQKKRDSSDFSEKSLEVPPQVGRSPRSDGNVCGISLIHYRRSSSVLSTMLTLNNLRVLERKPICLSLLFSATKV